MSSEWITEKLGKACLYLNRGISPVYTLEGGICVLNQKCIRNHAVDFSEARRHDICAKGVADERFVRQGDVLINSTGTGTLGRVAQLKYQPAENTTVDSHITIARPAVDKFCFSFFGYAIIAIEEAIKDAGDGCGGQTELSRKVLAEEFSITYPRSLVEQKRIADFLDQALWSIASAMASTEKSLQNAKLLFRSRLESLIAVRAEAWPQKKLADVTLQFGRGKSRHRPRNDPSLYGGPYPFIQTGDISRSDHWLTEYRQTYSEAGLSQSRLWPKGTICIAIVGATVGESAILGFDACFPDSVIGVVVDGDKADSEYVEYLLQAFKALLKEKGKGTARDNINLGTFECQEFPFPSVDKQKRIVTSLNALRMESLRLVRIYERKIDALEKLKISCLQIALRETGSC